MTESSENKHRLPKHRKATEFLRGQSSKVFSEVSDTDSVVIVNKNSMPHVVVISYERYQRLKDSGADI